ncbi:MAG: GNAT family N-acetyltransferase [Cytophagia bacterium]|nr:GNAT family N-acetyltransferase [Cytophagia bacterium]
MMPNIKIIQAVDPVLIKQVFAIRTEVFVHEQKCLPSEEFDELDAVAQHYLLFENELAVATGRFRKTDKGIKIERIATLNQYRGKGYATVLINHLMAVAQNTYGEANCFYLHAQVSVKPLYEKLGFTVYGNTFIEADIVHQAMEKTINR